jgi:hypothetical protein
MGFEGFDVVFCLTAPAVHILVENAGVASFQIGDDEACIGSFRAGLDPGNDALGPAPARGSMQKFREAAQFSIFCCGFKASLRAGFQLFDMGAQRRGGRNPENMVETVGSTPVENLRTAVVARSRIFVSGQLARIARTRRRRKARISVPFGRLAGRNTAVTKRPSLSNTRIGWNPYSS